MPSDSTLCRVFADTDPDALQAVLRRWAAPRAMPNAYSFALAADGNVSTARTETPPKGTYLETVTLLTHPRRAPAREPLLSRREQRERRHQGVAGGNSSNLRAPPVHFFGSGRSPEPDPVSSVKSSWPHTVPVLIFLLR